MEFVAFRPIPASYRNRMKAVHPRLMEKLENAELRAGTLYVSKVDWRGILDDLPAARTVKGGKVVRP